MVAAVIGVALLGIWVVLSSASSGSFVGSHQPGLTEYIARVERSLPKPVDRIAEELGRSLGTVKNHLWKARNEGFLKGGSAGRKGGFVPPEAAQIALDYLDSAMASLEDSDESET
jgi:hypothetical protein